MTKILKWMNKLIYNGIIGNPYPRIMVINEQICLNNFLFKSLLWLYIDRSLLTVFETTCLQEYLTCCSAVLFNSIIKWVPLSTSWETNEYLFDITLNRCNKCSLYLCIFHLCD